MICATGDHEFAGQSRTFTAATQVLTVSFLSVAKFARRLKRCRGTLERRIARRETIVDLPREFFLPARARAAAKLAGNQPRARLRLHIFRSPQCGPVGRGPTCEYTRSNREISGKLSFLGHSIRTIRFRHPEERAGRAVRVECYSQSNRYSCVNFCDLVYDTVAQFSKTVRINAGL